MFKAEGRILLSAYSNHDFPYSTWPMELWLIKMCVLSDLGNMGKRLVTRNNLSPFFTNFHIFLLAQHLSQSYLLVEQPSSIPAPKLLSVA